MFLKTFTRTLYTYAFITSITLVPVQAFSASRQLVHPNIGEKVYNPKTSIIHKTCNGLRVFLLTIGGKKRNVGPTNPKPILPINKHKSHKCKPSTANFTSVLAS